MRAYAFEKLSVWKDSCLLAKKIYILTNSFPKTEKFGLCSQLQRASISVSSNIAEGTSRVTCKDQSRFTNISYSSLMEVLSELQIAVDLEYINNKKYSELRTLIEKISYKLNKLSTYQKKF